MEAILQAIIDAIVNQYQTSKPEEQSELLKLIKHDPENIKAQIKGLIMNGVTVETVKQGKPIVCHDVPGKTDEIYNRVCEALKEPLVAA